MIKTPKSFRIAYSDFLKSLKLENRWFLRPSFFLFQSQSLHRPTRLKHSGIAMDVDLGDFVGFDLFVKGAFEEHNVLASLKYGVDGQDIIDIGANYGAYGLNLATRAGRMLMLEASAPLCQRLESIKESEQVKNTIIFQAAVSDRSNEVLKLYQGIRTKGDNSLIEGGMNSSEFEEVTTYTLDDIVDRHDFKPHLIKIDVEGFENRVLKGGSNTINEFHPAIIMEWNGSLIREQGLKLSDFPYVFDGRYDVFNIERNGELSKIKSSELDKLASNRSLLDLFFRPK